MNKFLKFSLWLLSNIALGYFIFLGVHGVQGAINVVVALAAISAVAAVAIHNNKEVIKDVASRGLYVPKWLRKLVDYSGIAVLVWYGWWFTALAWLIGSLFYAVFVDKVEREIKASKLSEESDADSRRPSSCGKSESACIRQAELAFGEVPACENHY